MQGRMLVEVSANPYGNTISDTPANGHLALLALCSLLFGFGILILLLFSESSSRWGVMDHSHLPRTHHRHHGPHSDHHLPHRLRPRSRPPQGHRLVLQIEEPLQ
jgi:hypothetical protein